MNIIKTLADLRALALSGAVSPAMAEYFAKELALLRDSLEPEIPLERFSLDVHGPIALLAPGEESLASIGVRGTVRDLIPEWVSRKAIGVVEWFAVFVLADNDHMLQIYVPRAGLVPDLEEWLAEQAEEDARGEGGLPEGHPF